MANFIEILSPGLFSSIQDTGRRGYLFYGVPMGGAMDMYSHKLANLYLQNPQDAASLEITLMGPVLKFSSSAEIVLTGADLSPTLSELPIEHSVVTPVKAGEVLSFGRRNSGCRTYIGVKGGFQTENILGSRSWFEGVTEHYRLNKGMEIPYMALGEGLADRAVADDSNARIKEKFDSQSAIEVFPGPEFSYLSKEQQQRLLSISFTISRDNSRMGIQLIEPVPNSLSPIITGPVLPGTVQLTPSGRLIVLMRDCQTTGGYPRVLQLSRHGVNQMAQRITGEKITWTLRSLN